MFWRGRDREVEQSGGLLCGHVRVLVVGDSGVGKTSLVNLITKGTAVARPPQTIGCAVSVKHVTCGSPAGSYSNLKGDGERSFFVELWEVSGHERYKDCRSPFYTQINGVIFVHDLSQRKTKTSLAKWATEISATGTFSVPVSSGGFGSLPVPYLVIGNKADIADKEGTRGSSGNLVDVARSWVEKQGLLPPSEELPLTQSFPGSTSLIAAAKEARFDKEALTKFFRTLIRRRYFSDELPVENSWSTSPLRESIYVSREVPNEVNVHRSNSLQDELYKYNPVSPLLPTQFNLTPPPTLYPQKPLPAFDKHSYQRFSMPDVRFSSSELNEADINV